MSGGNSQSRGGSERKKNRTRIDKHRNNSRFVKNYTYDSDEYGHFVTATKKFTKQQYKTIRLFYGHVIKYLTKFHMGGGPPQQRYSIIKMINSIIGDKNAELKIKDKRLHSSESVPIVDIWFHEHSSVMPFTQKMAFSDNNPGQSRVLVAPHTSNKSMGANDQDGLLFYTKFGIPLFVIRVHYAKTRKNTKIIHDKLAYSYTYLDSAIEELTYYRQRQIKNINKRIKDHLKEYNKMADNLRQVGAANSAPSSFPPVSIDDITVVRSKGINKKKTGDKV